MKLPDRPLTVLIAALGGEGGAVMADWLMHAATQCGFPAQATSIPGVAQRTGATTYYLEIYPARRDQLGGREPVLSLAPSPGDVDVMVASELIEAARAMQNGFVSPERTLLAASTHRIYATSEKMQMGDGRFDSARAIEAARKLARPVKWVGTRAEMFTSDFHGRAMSLTGELAMDADGNFLALRFDDRCDIGAYGAAFGSFIATRNITITIGGVYRIPALYARTRLAYTNTVPVDAYRGAGRPEATYVVERIVDGRDPVLDGLRSDQAEHGHQLLGDERVLGEAVEVRGKRSEQDLGVGIDLEVG